MPMVAKLAFIYGEFRRTVVIFGHLGCHLRLFARSVANLMFVANPAAFRFIRIIVFS